MVLTFHLWAWRHRVTNDKPVCCVSRVFHEFLLNHRIPEMILHAPAIITAPLATPEQSSSACRHWSRTRFSPKWTGSNTSFKHVISANRRSSLQTRGSLLSAVELSWVKTRATLPAQRRKASGVPTAKHVIFKNLDLPKSRPRYKICVDELK